MPVTHCTTPTRYRSSAPVRVSNVSSLIYNSSVCGLWDRKFLFLLLISLQPAHAQPNLGLTLVRAHGPVSISFSRSSAAAPIMTEIYINVYCTRKFTAGAGWSGTWAQLAAKFSQAVFPTPFTSCFYIRYPTSLPCTDAHLSCLALLYSSPCRSAAKNLKASAWE